MNDYLQELERALKHFPEIKGSGERFVIPEPKLLTEGKTTVLENFAVIVDKLNREPEHIFKFLLRELGTAGKIDGSRAIFQRRLTSGMLSDLINAYVKEYVTCSECGRPDTHLIKSERVLKLRCDACGAHRPLTKRRAASIIKEEALTEGESYDVRIDAVGSKGDGIAKKDKYTIYVPNTAKGDTVKIKIKKITGNLAFAEMLEKIT